MMELPESRSMSEILARIESPTDLQGLTDEQLQQLAQEMRDELVRVLSIRPAHFASNLGVVELCLALHLTFDFSHDRLIWDTGHQIYPHLFMTGHAGCSISCALGLKVGDDLLAASREHKAATEPSANGIGDESLARTL